MPSQLRFRVSVGKVHEAANAILKELKARVPRACLLRRVDADLDGGFAAALERAGFRGDRLSVWALQNARQMWPGPDAVRAALADVSNLAAYDSILLGEAPAYMKQRKEVDDLLASYGLLGEPVDVRSVVPPGRELAPEEGGHSWLFLARQMRLSLAEMGVYADHVAAAEEIGEDFEGTFD